jgi:ribosomal protein S18 acetylase RimI-like enzyme
VALPFSADNYRGKYRLEAGSALQRARLVKFMQRAYREMAHDSGQKRGPEKDEAPVSAYVGAHLADTVQRHLSARSKLWWLIDQSTAASVGLPGIHTLEPVGCLWMGEAIDQRTGSQQAYVFLLYIAPEHRHQGLGTALMYHAQNWAKQQGYGQISLQVFEDNDAAMQLYTKLGYQSQAKWMSLEI